MDDQWLSVAQAQGKFGADPQLAEYRQVRESLEESPQKELLLARWCQDRQLADEARFHWLNVLRMQPDNAEALGMLGMQWYNGLFLKREQVTEQRRKDRKASGMTMNPRSAHFRRWKSRIAHWELSAGRGDNNLLAAMEADLAAEASGDAILLVNHLIGRRSQEPKDPDAFQVVSLNWLTILARDPANTKFLVMHAIGHPMEPVRIAAAEELKKLPRQRYVPLLLACAQFPVEFAYSVLACSGLASVHYTLDIEGLEADTQIDHVDSLNIPADFYGPQMFWRHTITGLLTTPDDVKVEVQPRFPDPIRQLYPVWFTAAALGKARDMKRLVDQYNAAGAEINQRVTEALAAPPEKISRQIPVSGTSGGKNICLTTTKWIRHNEACPQSTEARTFPTAEAMRETCHMRDLCTATVHRCPRTGSLPPRRLRTPIFRASAAPPLSGLISVRGPSRRSARVTAFSRSISVQENSPTSGWSRSQRGTQLP